MNLKEKLKREDSLIEVLRETKQLNELMKSYIQVQMDNELIRNNNIVVELEEIKIQLTEIAIHTPTNNNRLLAKAYNNKGISLENLEQYESAMKCYIKALALNPNNDGILLNIGITLDHMGKHEEAIEHFNKVISNNEVIDLSTIDLEEELLEQFNDIFHDSSK